MNALRVCIMAGGDGTRFAPLSTPERPKQFLNFFGNGSFLQQTRQRITSLVPYSHVYVATSQRHVSIVQEQLPDILPQNIIGEPLKKNTSPCIAYLAGLLRDDHPDTVMVVLPSDHFIRDENGFLEVIRKAIRIAQEGNFLVTLGIRPDFPSTAYGYIRSSGKPFLGIEGACQAEAFCEKPSAEKAARYLNDGCYFWNSGIFVWRVRDIVSEISIHLPMLGKALSSFDRSEAYRQRFFEEAEAVSIDYGVMEKSQRVAVIPCDIGWSDVGSWESLHHLTQGGVSVSPETKKTLQQLFGGKRVNASELPRRVEKPWGYEEIWAHTDHYVGKILSINAPHRLSYQYHRLKEETLRVLDGVVDLEYEEHSIRKTIRLKGGDVFHIVPCTKHRMTAVETCRILEVSTPFLGDVVRLEDDYGRKELER